MAEVLFVGGIANAQTMKVDTSRSVIVVPHPIPPHESDFKKSLPDSVRFKTDRYQRRRRAELDGSISVVYVYEGTDD